jgi:hypothetical protein
MGGGASAPEPRVGHIEHISGETIDKSIGQSQFTILRFHGHTGAILASIVGVAIGLFVMYRIVVWRRNKWLAAKAARSEEISRGMEQRPAVPRMMGIGQFSNGRYMNHHAAAAPCNDEICNDCGGRAAPPIFQPAYGAGPGGGPGAAMGQAVQPDRLGGHFAA